MSKPTLLITAHAQQRLQQRGIPLEIVDLVYEFGTRQWSDGALAYSVDGRAKRRMQKAIGKQLAVQVAEQANGCYIVVSADEPVVITVARQLRRNRR